MIADLKYPELYIKPLIDKLVVLEKNYYQHRLAGGFYDEKMQTEIDEVKKELDRVLL